MPTVTATPLPSPTTAITCAGDCNGDGQVTIDELVRGVSIALDEAPVSACPSLDVDGNGVVEINELVRAVENALDGCS
jgi:Ca2+-binding EF-hand superfamily protein